MRWRGGGGGGGVMCCAGCEGEQKGSDVERNHEGAVRESLVALYLMALF